ncbi:T9SS type A sorting domain-containing protein [Dyadobacter sp. NIV53]|uniref:T9SS type A sorting domain-containing protein n=1 Tax=Dyadobacter sp. NIV53 TaxID=2861765 RepID=UPI001C87D73B|nr:T9SS type A sorting domain-containing protein [Dyadobacter sp. NIV53]
MIINEFKCYSDPSNKIITETLALPPAPAIAALGVTTICDGDFVALKATKGDSFIWNTGTKQDTIHVTEPGAYSARVEDSKGCLSPYSSQILVNVKTTPSIPVITQIGVYTLKADNNINDGEHIWKMNGKVLTETSTTIKTIESGSYIVNNSITYSAALTCFSDFSEPFTFIPDNKNNGMIAYPNPSNGNITIETVQNLTNATVQMIDSKGTVHKNFTIKKFDSQKYFNISDLSSGIYFIRVLSKSFNAYQKVVIVK